MRGKQVFFGAVLAMTGISAAGAAQVSVDTVSAGFGEPMVSVGPDGSVYIAALQGFFRSDNNGASWTTLSTPLNPTILASDSSIAIDPQGNVYLTFDYPYAGATASCTSTDKGANWLCNPAFMPGGTDRMWNAAPSATEYYVTTNQGLYQTVMGYSNDGGLAFTSYRAANEVLESYTGTMVKMSSGKLLQASDQGTERGIITWADPQLPASQSSPTNTLAPFTASGLQRSIGLEALVRTPDNTIYLAAISPDANGNNPVQLARSTDEGGHWKLLPPIPGTTSGSAVFPWIAAAENGHIGVVFYSTAARSAGGAPTPNATWDVTWAETLDAGADAPHWQLTKVSAGVHTGTVCTGLNCETAAGSTPNARFASDFISSAFAPDGAAHLAWVADNTDVIMIRHARVVSPHVPVVTIAANATSVETNQPITVTWTVGGAKACNATGDWSGAKAIGGGTQTLDSGPDAGALIYTLTCSNDSGSASQSAVVVVTPHFDPPPPGAPDVTLAASPSSVTVNQDVQLSWAVSNATSCTASGAWSGSKAASGGAETVNVGSGAGSRDYTLTCSNVTASTARTAHVVVNDAQAPPQSGDAGAGGGGGGGGGALPAGSLLLLALAAARRRQRR